MRFGRFEGGVDGFYGCIFECCLPPCRALSDLPGAAEFTGRYEWYRDHLLCSGCGSIPRERAMALVLERYFPDWRTLAIHESSPVLRGISLKLKRECAGYVASQLFPGETLGSIVRGFRNENLEARHFRIDASILWSHWMSWSTSTSLIWPSRKSRGR